MIPRVLIVADDLTGAADTGVAFARQGAETLVVWQDEPGIISPASAGPQAEVVVVSTESRHLGPDQAVQRMSAILENLAAGGGNRPDLWVYKKIDSTLRGHPGVELGALARGLCMRRALVAPAFPVQGRVTVGGLQFVDGVLLSHTVFGHEVPSSDVRYLFTAGFAPDRLRALSLDRIRAGSRAVAAELGADPAGVWIADAETDADLSVLATAAIESDVRLLCGSAGLAQAWAAAIGRRCGWTPAPSVPESGRLPGQGVLVVAASRHPRTLAQVAAAEAAGIPVIRPKPGWFMGDSDDGEMGPELITGLAQGAAVLTTAGLPEMPVEARALATCLARAVASVAARLRPAGLVLTGGDTAIAVSQALGSRALHLRGELSPGIPWGTLVGGSVPDLPVITKAGGFGEVGAFLEAIRFLAPS